MKIYISGKISGIENEALQLFEEAEEYLCANGYEPVNPMKLLHDHDKTWESYMREDLKAMLDCEGVFMLKNWESSTGAKIEHGLAHALNLKVFYQK